MALVTIDGIACYNGTLDQCRKFEQTILKGELKLLRKIESITITND